MMVPDSVINIAHFHRFCGGSLIDRNAIYPMIPPRGIGDGGRSMVAKLERVALREALPQRVVECAALEMRVHASQPVRGRFAWSYFL